MSSHEWTEPVLRDGTPVFPCRYCRVVWWPDRNEPKSECKGGKTDYRDRWHNAKPVERNGYV